MKADIKTGEEFVEGHMIAYRMRHVLRLMVKAHREGDSQAFFDGVELAHDVFARYGDFDREFWIGKEDAK